MEINKPTLFVVSAPSGAGKTTIIKSVKESIPQLVLSTSHTSRSPRQGEQHAKDYFFVSAPEFKKMIDNQEFLEWAEVHGNYYGTSKKEINRQFQKGKIVVLDIDVQGAMQIKGFDGIRTLYIFIEPPSVDELRNRLVSRGTETTESLEKRIGNACEEIGYKKEYDYIIINDDLEKAVEAFKNIILQNSAGV
jgi:guanylate kinase